MASLSRRGFLAGLVAVVVAPALPPLPAESVGNLFGDLSGDFFTHVYGPSQALTREMIEDATILCVKNAGHEQLFLLPPHLYEQLLRTQSPWGEC